MEYRNVEPAEIDPALRWILGSGQRPADDRHIAEFKEFARYRRIDLHEIVVAARSADAPAGPSIVGALLAVISPGRTALLLGPGDGSSSLGIAEWQELMEATCTRCAAQGVHLVQALLDPTDRRAIDRLLAQQFRRIAELLYLHTTLRARLPQVDLPPACHWDTYSPATHVAFAAAIADSYRGSLDCPGINGLRDIEDVIAGHKAGGEFDPAFWFLLRDESRTLGVLLLNRVAHNDIAELVYLGVAPAVRDQGIGSTLVRHALWSAAQMPARRLTLAVDSQNGPAVRLYYRTGLARAGSKVAMLRDLRPDPASAQPVQPS